jgi:hypothetical protein
LLVSSTATCTPCKSPPPSNDKRRKLRYVFTVTAMSD